MKTSKKSMGTGLAKESDFDPENMGDSSCRFHSVQIGSHEM